jgi:hypothetical protein
LASGVGARVVRTHDLGLVCEKLAEFRMSCDAISRRSMPLRQVVTSLQYVWVPEAQNTDTVVQQLFQILANGLPAPFAPADEFAAGCHGEGMI